MTKCIINQKTNCLISAVKLMYGYAAIYNQIRWPTHRIDGALIFVMPMMKVSGCETENCNLAATI